MFVIFEGKKKLWKISEQKMKKKKEVKNLLSINFRKRKGKIEFYNRFFFLIFWCLARIVRDQA